MYFQKKGTVKKNGVFLIKGVTYTHNTLAGITDVHTRIMQVWIF